ncbi:hypothetical protein HPP92_005111 [Vanilla planifolia]|uniref:Alpha/beta hydrolase fold-3 domain-containing protein n=1 Tax=Vanilla planifolia TaxID=51239 RepID=A0A835RYV0_VANPL|nr:hypothetical protein HPP92_005111 [Vanilla planifolia]
MDSLVSLSPSSAFATSLSFEGIDSDDEVIFQFLPLIRVYRSGRVERLVGMETVPAAFDLPTGVLSKDIVIDPTTGVSARLYLPVSSLSAISGKLPVLVYFHGGGFLIESPFSPTYHPHLNDLSSLGPLLAVSVNYRLAPEHPLPTAYEDSWAALQWVLSRADTWLSGWGDFGRVYLGGDSAGANICQEMAVRAGKEGVKAIKGMALVCPYFWGEKPVGTEDSDPSFRGDMERLWRFLFPGTIGLEDPRIDPVAETAPSLAMLGCRRVLVAVAGKDMLWNRGWLYYERLKSSSWEGVAEMVDVPNVEHIFHILQPETDEARPMTKRLTDFFAQ